MRRTVQRTSTLALVMRRRYAFVLGLLATVRARTGMLMYRACLVTRTFCMEMKCKASCDPKT